MTKRARSVPEGARKGTPVEGSRGRIAVVAMDVRLAGETSGLDREAYIARLLAGAGFQVDLITSAFQHWEKRQRDCADPAYAAEPFTCVFVPARGYRRNITPARVASHAETARRVRALLARRDYDLVLAKVPPNDLARVCAEYAEARDVPLVADVNDLWPEAMRLVLDVPGVADVALRGFARDADFTYARCAAVIGTSDSYAARALAAPGVEAAPPGDAGRPGRPQLLTVHVGTDVAAFDAEAAATPAPPKPQGAFWATYAGTIGASYGLESLVRAAALAARATDRALTVNILGDGPDRPRLQELAAQLGAPVSFPGYLPHAQMAAWLVQSDVLVNSFARKAPQSIVSKVGDYLAAGRPMVNALADAEFAAKVDAGGFGVNVPPEDPAEMAAALVALADDPQACAEMGLRARAMAEAEFDRATTYPRIVDLARTLLS